LLLAVQATGEAVLWLDLEAQTLNVTQWCVWRMAARGSSWPATAARAHDCLRLLRAAPQVAL
jgi:hypothetical protein